MTQIKPVGKSKRIMIKIKFSGYVERAALYERLANRFEPNRLIFHGPVR